MKGANSIDEAVSQFYENPEKYSTNPVSSMADPKEAGAAKEAKKAKATKEAKVDDNPPPYAPPPARATNGRARHRPHTNAIIEAANVRARDEVRYTPT